MSRSGYSEDCDDERVLTLYRANVDRTIHSKRGQKFFRDLVEALEALPEKRLIADVLDRPAGTTRSRYDFFHLDRPSEDVPYPPEQCGVCAMGALARARGVDLTKVDPEATDYVGKLLGVSGMLAREVAFENDEHFSWGYGKDPETPEQRYTRMLAWAKSQIKEEPCPPQPSSGS